ncbi:MAG: FHA domain-containing protein [Anaerohalosphaeraceae bacterium]|nr:FHA domain-containing protein [Anaerohalosphaeraceae bacterium]
MEVALVLQKKDGTRKTFPVPNKATILGRRPDCDLCIPLQVVSRRHCQFSQEEQSLKIRDLHSSNGTFLNGEKVLDSIDVKPGDKVQVGPLTFTVKIDGRPESISAADSAIIQPSPAPTVSDEELLNGNETYTGQNTV